MRKDFVSAYMHFTLVQVLSPVCFDQPPSSNLPNQKLVETNKCCSRVTAEQPVFTESWPASSDCDSSPTSSIACHDMENIAEKVTSGKITISSKWVNWQVSDLTKCVLSYNIQTKPIIVGECKVPSQPQMSLLCRSREHFCDSPLLRRKEQMDYGITEQQLSFWQTTSSSVPPSSTPTKATDMRMFSLKRFSNVDVTTQQLVICKILWCNLPPEQMATSLLTSVQPRVIYVINVFPRAGSFPVWVYSSVF